MGSGWLVGSSGARRHVPATTTHVVAQAASLPGACPLGKDRGHSPKFLWFHEGKRGLIFPKEGLEHEEGCRNFYFPSFGASLVGQELI